ncbi:hypothetical protein [Actinomadura citrea]|uniref:Uncharacterized protein n=1 Tax=Actinomadura citrea TaxID=46158 RepID=A0A7Y9GE28_9ACTN|nr:hypothetical protein [Actinomadura citrea]NYE14792.1 hypothetical protein [Actinomadura citrea]GGT82844.1 hypothetical protein GCM10010177_47430 [Actinomadura citrea]
MTELEPGRIDFYDGVAPGLRDDTYRVRVTTTVEHSATADHAGAQPLEVFTEDRWVKVAGAKYRLDPSEILSVYPPPDSAGAYTTTLGHVVLRRRTLPWEKAVAPSTSTPWLALLLLDVNEATINRNVAAPDGTRYTTVSMSADVARAALPLRAEVPLLCHARQVAPGGPDTARDDDGWVAVVMTGRLPVAGRAYNMCLVSLADHGAVLDRGSVPATVTLPVLHDWTFKSGSSGTFQKVAAGVAQNAAAFGLSAGHPARLDHTRRDGTPGVALYRGPIVGVADEPAVAAEAETDVSLSTARTLGRLLAAADRSLVRELSEWRRRDLMSGLGPPAFAAGSTPGDVAAETVARLSGATADPWGVPDRVRRLHARRDGALTPAEAPGADGGTPNGALPQDAGTAAEGRS